MESKMENLNVCVINNKYCLIILCNKLMPSNLTPFPLKRSTRLFTIFKYYSLSYSLLEVIFIILSAVFGLFLQMEICLLNISLQGINIISIGFMIYKFNLNNIKLCIFVATLGAVLAIILILILND